MRDPIKSGTKHPLDLALMRNIMAETPFHTSIYKVSLIDISSLSLSLSLLFKAFTQDLKILKVWGHLKGKPHLIQLQVSQDPSWTFKKIIQPPNVHAAHVVHSACSTGSCLAYLRLNNKKQPVQPGRCSLEILGSSTDDHIFFNKTFSKATWPGLETTFFFLVVFIKLY